MTLKNVVTQARYCSGSGLSRPYERMSASICSGGTRGVRKRSVGSPGEAYTMRNTIIETPMRMGIAWMTRRSRYCAI